jgi:hypothetical protein
VWLNTLAYIAAGQITTVAAPHVTERNDLIEITGVEDAATIFVNAGAFPSAQGIAWATPGGRATSADRGALPTVIERMVAEHEG